MPAATVTSVAPGAAWIPPPSLIVQKKELPNGRISRRFCPIISPAPLNVPVSPMIRSAFATGSQLAPGAPVLHELLKQIWLPDE